MLHDENLRDEVRQNDYYFLWRLRIDRRYQKCGFGRRAIQLLVEHVVWRCCSVLGLIQHGARPMKLQRKESR